MAMLPAKMPWTQNTLHNMYIHIPGIQSQGIFRKKGIFKFYILIIELKVDL